MENAQLTETSSTTKREEYDLLEHGCSGIRPIASAGALAPVQQLLYDLTRDLIVEHDASLPLAEKLRLPFSRPSTAEEFSKVMRTINESSELETLIASDEVKKSFVSVFKSEKVERFPISRFRAQFPTLSKSTYDWHQDEGTWYAVKDRDLAGCLPATLWLSLNGASKQNSIEIIPYSHLKGLEEHKFVNGQGYFQADLPDYLEKAPRFVIATEPGQGVFFHALTFHRSVVNSINQPRYSIDIRYYAAEHQEAYRVPFKFKMKRFFA